MNCFDILCIPEGSDKKTITESYERLVQFHDPKDDPKGYKELCRAYNKALKYEKMHGSVFKTESNNLYTEDNIALNVKADNRNRSVQMSAYRQEERAIDCFYEPSLYYSKEEDLSKEQKYEMDNLVRNLKELYNNFENRIDINKWYQLLEDSYVILNSEAAEIIERNVFRFLIKHKNIPSDVWKLLNNRLHFAADEEELFKLFGSYDTNKILININNPNNLSYQYLDEIEKERLEDYLDFRESAYYSLNDNNLNDTKRFMMQAYQIWKYDSELLRIMGNYHLLKNDCELASDFLLEALNINPQDMKAKELYDKCKLVKEFIQNEEIEAIKKARKKDNSFLKDIMGFLGAIIIVGLVFMLMFLKFALKSMAAHNRAQNRTTSSQQVSEKKSDNKKIPQSKNAVKAIDTLSYETASSLDYNLNGFIGNHEVYINGEIID